MDSVNRDNTRIQTANERIDEDFFVHSLIVNELESQYETLNLTKKIFDSAISEIHEASELAKEKFALNNYPLSSKEIKDLKKELSKGNAKVSRILAKMQRRIRIDVATQDPLIAKNYVDALDQGGARKFFVHFMAFFGSTAAKKAISAFQEAHKKMEETALAAPKKAPSTLLSKERVKLLNDPKAIKQRAGALLIEGTFHIFAKYTEEEMQKQISSVKAQMLSASKRDVLSKTIQFNDKVALEQTFCPLNAHFDKRYGGSHFGSIFGEGGISSTDARSRNHLVNGYEVEIRNPDSGKLLFRSIRHGALADKKETNESVRKASAKQASEELASAALLQQLKDQDLSLEAAATLDSPLKIYLTSVSLLTPDDFRALAAKLSGNQGTNEKKMLQDQVDSLKALEKLTHLEIGGFKIPVQFVAMPFNFGVNDAAIGSFHLGAQNQHTFNSKAYKELSDLEKRFAKVSSDHKSEINRLKADEKREYNSLLSEITLLKNDLDSLLSKKEGYLEGDNQYEAGAKLLILSNLMSRAAAIVNPKLPKGSKLPFVQSMFNCMSAKDRTGMMQAAVTSFVAQAEIRGGRYQTHNTLTNDKAKKEEFTNILAKSMLEGGNIEITEINSGVAGLKITSNSGRIALLKESRYDELFKTAVGLSKTTSS